MNVPGDAAPPAAGDGPGPGRRHDRPPGAVAAPGPGTCGLVYTEPWYLGPLWDLLSDITAATGGAP